MTHPDRAEDYLEQIADAIQRATRYVGNLKNLEALEKDEQAQGAIVRTIAVIGEAANRIQKVRARGPNRQSIPWSNPHGSLVHHSFQSVAELQDPGCVRRRQTSCISVFERREHRLSRRRTEGLRN